MKDLKQFVTEDGTLSEEAGEFAGMSLNYASKWQSKFGFMEEYKEFQKNISEVERGLELRKGHEWALKKDSFHYGPENFWVEKMYRGDLYYFVPDGGGHCKQHKIPLGLLLHEKEEREEWMEESIRICEEKMEANTKKWENRMLDTRLDLIKRAVVEKQEGYVDYATGILEEILNSH